MKKVELSLLTNTSLVKIHISFIQNEKVVQLKTGEPNFERKKDAERRFNSHLKYVENKNIIDFGCGSGEFLN